MNPAPPAPRACAGHAGIKTALSKQATNTNDADYEGEEWQNVLFIIRS